MPSTVTNRHRIRHSFGHIQAPLLVPHLLKIQLDSYERFLQREVPPDQRKDEGLEAVFRSVFPISDFSGSSTLEYVHYRLGDPKYSVEGLQNPRSDLCLSGQGGTEAHHLGKR